VSCFGVGFSLCLITGCLFLCLASFLWGKVSDQSASPLLSVWWFADYFSIFHCHLTLDVAHCLRRWALWTTTGPISGSGLSPAHCQPFCLSSLCLLKVHTDISSLPFPTSLVRFWQVHPSAVW
jgi:hypothetical protein